MKNRIKEAMFLAAALTIALSLTLGGTSEAVIPYVNSRVNIDSSSNQANGSSDNAYSVSKDGRYVAFTSSATNLVSSDTNNLADVFVRDRLNNNTVRVSVSSTGSESDGSSFNPKITPNGRYVIFSSEATNLTSPGGVSGKKDLFIRDMQNNTTALLYLTNSGGLLNDDIGYYAISADARYIVFTTDATNVVSGDTNNATDVFVRDRVLGTTTLLSQSDGGIIGDSYAIGTVSISCDGALVAFSSNATNLVSGDTNGKKRCIYS